MSSTASKARVLIAQVDLAARERLSALLREAGHAIAGSGSSVAQWADAVPRLRPDPAWYRARPAAVAAQAGDVMCMRVS